nr:hypothetical protein [uncultured Acetatifactor sp.]
MGNTIEKSTRTIKKTLSFENSGETLSVEISLENVSPGINMDAIIPFLNTLFANAKEAIF